MAKLVSMKDGCSGRRESTYCGYAPSTYKIVNDAGEVLGFVNQMKDVLYNFRTTCWVGACGDTKIYAPYLSDVRKMIKDL